MIPLLAPTSTDNRIAVGFGISTTEQAQSLEETIHQLMEIRAQLQEKEERERLMRERADSPPDINEILDKYWRD